jgi:hypothetical protein
VRLAAKAKGLPASVVKRAQRLLMVKLGICMEEDRLSKAQLKEYAATFVFPLGPEQILAIAALFGLACAADTRTFLWTPRWCELCCSRWLWRVFSNGSQQSKCHDVECAWVE